MPKRLNILTHIETVDWIAFNQIYTPILGLEAANLYMSFYCQKQIFTHLNIESYDLHVFVDNLNMFNINGTHNPTKIDFHSLKKQLKLLEEFNLTQVSIKEDLNGTNYFVQLLPPLSIKAAMQDDFIKSQLEKVLTSHKFAEICLLIDKNNCEYGLRVDLENDNEHVKINPVHTNNEEKQISTLEITTNKTEKVNKEIYYEFYNGVFQKTGNVFVLSDKVLQMIQEAYLGDEKIPMETIQCFGIQSLKQKHKKYYVCEESFEYLINSEIQSNTQTFDVNVYKNFWISLINTDNVTTKNTFEKLFHKHSPINFYMHITKKDCHPVGLEKWVNDCTKQKHFSFHLLNAMMSFVKVWIQKIPINYLTQFANTIYEDNLLSTEEFLEYIKGIIDHDIRTGRNRWQIQLKKLNITNQNIKFKNSSKYNLYK